MGGIFLWSSSDVDGLSPPRHPRLCHLSDGRSSSEMGENPRFGKLKEEKISYGMNALLNMNAPESQKRQKLLSPLTPSYPDPTWRLVASKVAENNSENDGKRKFAAKTDLSENGSTPMVVLCHDASGIFVASARLRTV
jgi:hypothetical protein